MTIGTLATELVNSTTKLVNTTSIESPFGYKSINLYVGDITTCRDELLVVSSYPKQAGEPVGAVIQAFKQSHGLSIKAIKPLILMNNVIGTYRVAPHEGSNSHFFKDILVVKIPGGSGDNSELSTVLEVYGNLLWTVFGSIAALEQGGNEYRSMAMPLLGGQRGYPLQDSMEIILRQATRHLKSSRTMTSVNIYLDSENTLLAWSSAMDKVLGRRLVDAAKHQVIAALRSEILVKIRESSKFSSADFSDVITPLESALKADTICLQLVAAFGRSLVERIVSKILLVRKIPSKNNLQQNISTLAYQEVVAPWMASHFHSLRVFGNEILHGKDKIVNFRPDRLEEEDLVAVLASICRTVTFWSEW